MLAISELELVSRVPAVVIPPLVVAQAPLVSAVSTNIIRVDSLKPAVFRNHSPAGNPQMLIQPSEKQSVPARHLDRFG